MYNLIQKIQYFYVNWVCPTHERKRKFLIAQGARIGKGTRMGCRTGAFGSEPYLITVGENCWFGGGAHLLTHDGGVLVLNNLKKWEKGMDKMGPIKIGNNVYTGVNVLIMPGVTIGDNVVIGAGSIVTHDVPSNCVVLGIPGKVVCSLDDYYKRACPRVVPTYGMPYKDKKAFLLNHFKHLL